jgi:hypothetical protein
MGPALQPWSLAIDQRTCVHQDAYPTKNGRAKWAPSTAALPFEGILPILQTENTRERVIWVLAGESESPEVVFLLLIFNYF